MLRLAISLIAACYFALTASAQQVNLTEKSTLGERASYALELELKGNLIVHDDRYRSTTLRIPLEAKAKHRFTERHMALTEGLPSTTARYYTEATATAIVETDKSTRSLPVDRKLIIARLSSDGLFCFSPGGSLSRDELDLVTDHFNTQCLPGLLPGKTVNVGDTWKLSDSVVQAACRFDATIKSSFTGKLTSLKDGIATFTIDGSVEGLENGSKISLTVAASGEFDAAAGHINSLVWKQKDQRDQGPANPASQVEARITLKRDNIVAGQKELSDESLAAIPDGELPPRLTDLRQVDPKGRYALLHSRNWYVTGQTDAHLIIRLLDRGELIAQATVTVWNKMEPGKHVAIDDFKKAVASAPGWTPGKTIADGELPAPAGRWLYRLEVEGKMEDVPVVQTFYLLAGPQGDQVVVTVAAKPEKVKAIANRDLSLVNAIEFGKK
jgi:hypothetical protein